jgi:hypothetical protein
LRTPKIEVRQFTPEFYFHCPPAIARTTEVDIPSDVCRFQSITRFLPQFPEAGILESSIIPTIELPTRDGEPALAGTVFSFE